jgi:EAL domain-containing protein (putative c-di-GMP-specific phosphodiesterase class I)
MSVILQLHESDVINDLKAAKTFAAAVHQLGCRFSISGFGRIPEAEKTLKNVQTDIVQIDGGLTRNLQTSGDASALKALVAAIGASDVKTIVPFVENASVLATLWQVGADFIQGHYLQAPSREMNYEFTDIA